MSFFHLSLDDLHIQQEAFPQVILDVEKCELGIAAGLQDRVVQTYGGLVHMDFSIPSQAPKYISISPTLLPPMYLCYNKHAGGESGKTCPFPNSNLLEQSPSGNPLLAHTLSHPLIDPPTHHLTHSIPHPTTHS